MKMIIQLKIWGVAWAFVWLAMGNAMGQIVPPLNVGNLTPVKDVLGHNYPGSWTGDPAVSARVEIREVGTHIMPPDPATGAGNDAINPLFLVTRMGNGVMGVNPGMFSENLSSRLPAGKAYFARVYDKSSVSAAKYYVNSNPFQEVAPELINVTPSLEVVFLSRQRVDGLPDPDTDGDGLPDDMEMDMGLDPNSSDTDRDGYSDYFEAVHSQYMNATEPDEPWSGISYNPPEYAGDPPVQTGPHTVSWWTLPVPGLEYRLEYTDALPYEEAFTMNIWSGTATETNLVIDVDDWVRTNAFIQGFFRVWAVTLASP